MATPAIQTLLTDAQQVLNLNSLSEVRSTMAAALANANVGTPLNPNLTTQQLWDEFYLIVRQPESDIESIITNQLMKFLFAPPAPGGAGANHEVIYNNNGVLAGDSKFLWDDALNKLDIDGSATISGDLTVDTSTLKVDSANDRVGIGTATPAAKLIVRDGTNRNLLVSSDATQLGSTGIAIGGFTDNAAGYAPLSLLASAMQFGIGGTTAMTLNASGLLGLGVAPKTWSSGLAFEVSSLLKIASSSLFGAAIANNAYYNVGWKYSTANTANLYQTISGEHRWLNAPSGTADAAITFTQAMTLDASGNLLVGPTSSVYKLDTYTILQGAVTTKQFANRTSNKILVKRYFSISADTALFSIECGTAGSSAMAAFEINVFATGQKSGSSSDRQFYGKFYVTRNLAGTFTITSAFSSGSSGAFTVTASGTSLNVNGIFSVISDGSACVEITGYIGGRDTVNETALTVTMP